jgi:hypothetical protein
VKGITYAATRRRLGMTRTNTKTRGRSRLPLTGSIAASKLSGCRSMFPITASNARTWPHQISGAIDAERSAKTHIVRDAMRTSSFLIGNHRVCDVRSMGEAASRRRCDVRGMDRICRLGLAEPLNTHERTAPGAGLTQRESEKSPCWGFASFGTGNLPSLWTDTWPPNSTAILAAGDHRGVKCWVR